MGFAHIPWLGKAGPASGGYQLSYISMSGNFNTVQSAAGQNPGFTYVNNWNNAGAWEDGDYFGIRIKSSPLFRTEFYYIGRRAGIHRIWPLKGLRP